MRYKVCSNSEWRYRFNCIFCEGRGKTKDRKFHLYLNVKNGLMHCFRCNYWGVVEKESEFYKFLGNGIVNKIINNNTRRDFLSPLLSSLPDLHYKYLISRGVEKDVIKDYFYFNSDFSDYVFTSQSRGWIGRRVKEGEPRYICLGDRGIKLMISHNEYRNELPIDIENFRFTLFIVEGIFTSVLLYQIGISSICTLGKSVSSEQLNEIITIIKNVYHTDIIICPDWDARDSWILLYIKLLTNLKDKRINFRIIAGYKDLSEYLGR